MTHEESMQMFRSLLGCIRDLSHVVSLQDQRLDAQARLSKALAEAITGENGDVPAPKPSAATQKVLKEISDLEKLFSLAEAKEGGNVVQ